MKTNPFWVDILLTIQYFDWEEEWLQRTGWSKRKYDSFMRGELFPFQYKEEIPSIIRGFRQNSKSYFFWSQKWEKWMQSIMRDGFNDLLFEDTSAYVEGIQNLKGETLVKLHIPEALKDFFPPSHVGSFYMRFDRVSKNISYRFTLEDGEYFDWSISSTSELFSNLEVLTDYLLSKGVNVSASSKALSMRVSNFS